MVAVVSDEEIDPEATFPFAAAAMSLSDTVTVAPLTDSIMTVTSDPESTSPMTDVAPDVT